jgi:tRNA(Ile)-lysidine synthase
MERQVQSQENGFLATVGATIRRHGMLEPGDTVLVGVSGGPDSVALLHALVSLGPAWSLCLIIAHLNHRLRGPIADKEAAFVETLGSHLQLPCVIGSKDVRSISVDNRLSIQEAARKARYAFFEETAEAYNAKKIALGHQKNDNAESVLMHLIRGTGPKGLAGIPPIRQNRIIRPLLDVGRKQILRFLKRHGLEYMLDRSNLDDKYLRNRVRHELVPFLDGRFNANSLRRLTRLASIARDEEDFWDAMVEKAFEGVAIEYKDDRIVLSAVQLARLHRALLRRVIRHSVLALTGSLNRLDHNHVEAVARLIAHRGPAKQLDLPQAIGVTRDGDEICFAIGPQAIRPQFEYRISGTGTTRIPEIGKTLRLMETGFNGLPAAFRKYPLEKAFFDLDALSFPLVVRNFRPGDRFTPLGITGSQKVKDFFINQKVPRFKRHTYPLLLSKGKIIWVGGRRIDDSVKVTETTRRVLQAELLPE